MFCCSELKGGYLEIEDVRWGFEGFVGVGVLKKEKDLKRGGGLRGGWVVGRKRGGKWKRNGRETEGKWEERWKENGRKDGRMREKYKSELCGICR